MFSLLKQCILCLLSLSIVLVHAMEDNPREGTELLSAIRRNDIVKIPKLIKKQKCLNTPCKGPFSHMYTPLIYAARWDNDEAVQLLINNGAQVGVADYDEYTPLHCAARYASCALVKKILSSCPDVNAQAKDGSTPLYEAVIALVRKEKETEAIIRALLQANADPKVTVSKKTLLQHAQEHRDQNSQNILKAALGKQ